jgi:hypothetical protein
MHYHDIPAFITICCISDHARFHHCLFIEHRRVRSYNKTYYISANKTIADPTIKHYYIVQLVQHFILH